MAKAKDGRGQPKHDWTKLKTEFLTGDWVTVKQFLEDKGIPYSNSKQCVGWMQDKKQYQQEVLKQSSQAMMEEDVEDILKVRKRQARLARFMQLKGAKVLETEEIEDVDTARKLVVSGLKEERKVLGMEGGGKKSFTQINIGAKTNMDKLIANADYEELLEFIAELKRERARRSLSSSAEQSSGKVEEGEVV